MKTLLLYCLLLIGAIACKKEDLGAQEPESPQAVNTSDLEGAWRLIRFEPGFGPTSEYANQINWTITENGILVVIDEGTNVSTSMPFNTSGTYDYELLSSDSVQFADQSFQFLLQGDSLIIQQNVAADGMRMTFRQ
jgi:hypothetical protein